MIQVCFGGAADVIGKTGPEQALVKVICPGYLQGRGVEARAPAMDPSPEIGLKTTPQTVSA